MCLGSNLNYFCFWTLVACIVSTVAQNPSRDLGAQPHVLGDLGAPPQDFLEVLNAKCNLERSHNNPQSYVRSNCFQYNTLANIHHLLSFGEELLQIGPIDLIYLESDFHHPMQASHQQDKARLIVYPENTEEILQLPHYNRSKPDHYASLSHEDNESEMVPIRNRRRQNAIEHKHNETKREANEQIGNTEYYVDEIDDNVRRIIDENESINERQTGINYYLRDEDYIEELERNDEAFETKTQIDESVIESVRKRNRKTEHALRSNEELGINNGENDVKTNEYPKRNMENVMKNKAAETHKDMNHAMRHLGHKTRDTVVLQDEASIELLDGPKRVKVSKAAHEGKTKLDSRALHRQVNSDSNEIQMLKKKEEMYFLSDDGDLSSSVEDMKDMPESFEATTIRHLPVKLSQPKQAKPHEQGTIITNSERNPSDHQVSEDEYEKPQDSDYLNQRTHEEILNSKEAREQSENSNALHKTTREKSHQENETEKDEIQDKHTHNDEIQNEQTKNGSASLRIENHSTNRKPNGNEDRDAVNETKAVHGRPNIHTGVGGKEDARDILLDNNTLDNGNAETSQNGVPSTESSDRGTQESTNWLLNFDQIATRLNEIVSTYGITIPIPDWSEDLPAIIPLDERQGKGGKKDQSMSRRRTNNKHGTKKYMALFPLVAVLKFMVIKALLVPLLIAVLIIKKILILGVIAMPYVFSLLRICRNGPGFGFLFNGGGGIGGGGGLGGNQVAANAPYLSAVDTAVDYTQGYGAHGGNFGGGVARWMDRHYPTSLVAGHHKQPAGEVGLMDRK